jgi:hypothetical protein
MGIEPAGAIDTMNGEALHEAALLCLCTALGWVYPSDEVFAAIGRN